MPKPTKSPEERVRELEQKLAISEAKRRKAEKAAADAKADANKPRLLARAPEKREPNP